MDIHDAKHRILDSLQDLGVLQALLSHASSDWNRTKGVMGHLIEDIKVELQSILDENL